MKPPIPPKSFPEMYEQALVGPLFRPWAELMLDEVELARGDRVLDIACGTGIVARLAAQRLSGSGKVVGIDQSPAMLSVARQLAPAIDWREGDAAALPTHAGEQFDVVVCQQGLQFFPDASAAVHQMRRALIENGRLALSTWRADEECPVLLALRRIAERHLGPIVDRRHSMGEAASIRALLQEAGFTDVNAGTVSRRVIFEDGAAFTRINARALISMSAASAAMADGERARMLDLIASDSDPVVKRSTDAQGFGFEIRANVVTARG